MTDLDALTDTDLDTLRRQVLTEAERRTRVAALPAQMRQMAVDYVSAGGDPTTMQTAVDDALTTVPG